MRITALDGNPTGGSEPFDRYMQHLQTALQASGNQLTFIRLHELNIRYCTGCFNCWIKTPGRCVIEDDAAMVRRAAINSDLLLFCSPVSMGMVSAELKRALDRMIPLLLPYMEFDQGELHHRRRYKKYPQLGLVLGQYGDTDAEDLQIIERSFQRFAINFKSRLVFTRLADTPVQEVLDEINRL
jgi:multimeric flavodoxin WrbA